MELEDTIKRMGITVDFESPVDLDTYEPTDARVTRADIIKYKRVQGKFHQNHDLAAVEKILSMRKRTSRKIENVGFFFLSSDHGLAKYNFEKMHHKDNTTVPEVIIDSLLTSILWLKNPKANVSLRSVIAAYSRELFVNRHVWENFAKQLRKLRETGAASEDDISILLHNENIEQELMNIDEADADTIITEQYALEKIAGAVDKRRETEKAKDTELIELREKTKEEKIANQAWLTKFTNYRQQVTMNAKRRLEIWLLHCLYFVH